MSVTIRDFVCSHHRQTFSVFSGVCGSTGFTVQHSLSRNWFEKHWSIAYSLLLCASGAIHYQPWSSLDFLVGSLQRIWEHKRTKKYFFWPVCLPPSIFKSSFLVRGLVGAILAHNTTEGALGSHCHLGVESLLETSLFLLLIYTTQPLAVWKFWCVTCWLIAELAKVRRVLREASVQRAKQARSDQLGWGSRTCHIWGGAGTVMRE